MNNPIYKSSMPLASIDEGELTILISEEPPVDPPISSDWDEVLDYPRVRGTLVIQGRESAQGILHHCMSLVCPIGETKFSFRGHLAVRQYETCAHPAPTLSKAIASARDQLERDAAMILGWCRLRAARLAKREAFLAAARSQ